MTIGGTLMTLSDWRKRLDPNDKHARIVEMLEQTNDIIIDMPFKEGNLETGHRTTVRTGLPTPTWRLLNRGVANTKSTTAQIDEACGILEDRSQVDVDLANLNGDVGAFRLSESSAHFEGMNQEMAATLFYGNSGVSPQEFTGLAPRYSSLAAQNGRNIIDAGGLGSDNSSIWLAVWGETTVHGIYPKGSKAGLVHNDLGIGDAFDSENKRFRAYMDQYQWKCGLALRDWRYVVRIANIDISNLVTKTTPADLIELMIKATHRVQNLRAGKPVFYMNRSCAQMLDIFKRDAVMAGGGLTYKEVDGVPQYSFRGIPVRICDALHESEGRVA
jgi:hypothetical protein